MARIPVGGVIALEGVQTGDGRLIQDGAITWADLPLPLAWLQVEQHSAPADGVQVGIITELARSVGGEIRWAGFVDDQIPEGREVIRRMEAGTAPFGNRWGISIDPDDYEVELVAPNGVQDEPMVVLASGMHAAGGRGVFRLGAGTRQSIPEPQSLTESLARIRPPVRAAAGDGDSPAGTVVMEASSDEIIERATRLRIRGATLCAVPAFDGAYAELTGQSMVDGIANGVRSAAELVAASATTNLLQTDATIWNAGLIVDDAGAPILAAGFPLAPPVEWFDDPELDEPTPLTITDDGRVFGHLGTWNSCHDGFPGTRPGDRDCVMLPQDADYTYFTRRGPVMRCREGCEIPIGTLTMDTGHHRPTNHQATESHYDDTGTQVAYVTAGTDQFGPWVAGCVRPDLSAEDVVRLRASPPSVDMRPRDGKLELRAVLLVNVPGFPVERGLAASGAPEDDALRSEMRAMVYERLVDQLDPYLIGHLENQIVPTT